MKWLTFSKKNFLPTCSEANIMLYGMFHNFGRNYRLHPTVRLGKYLDAYSSKRITIKNRFLFDTIRCSTATCQYIVFLFSVHPFVRQETTAKNYGSNY